VDTTKSSAPAHPFTRELRALELYRAHRRDIERVAPDVYLVPSRDGKRAYRVDYHNETCNCPDHNFHPETACKHILAVGISVARRCGETGRRLEALEERIRHEFFVDDEERQELRGRIARIRRRLREGLGE
jgi:hypothetical protein